MWNKNSRMYGHIQTEICEHFRLSFETRKKCIDFVNVVSIKWGLFLVHVSLWKILHWMRKHGSQKQKAAGVAIQMFKAVDKGVGCCNCYCDLRNRNGYPYARLWSWYLSIIICSSYIPIWNQMGDNALPTAHLYEVSLS